MFGNDKAVDELGRMVLDYAEERLTLHPVPLDYVLSETELLDRAGQTITTEGIGGARAMDLFAEVLAPACSGRPARSAIQRSAWFSAKTAPEPSSQEPAYIEDAPTTRSNIAAASLGAHGMKER